jgi:riboflavin kinase/FMN adenylyltransferase
MDEQAESGFAALPSRAGSNITPILARAGPKTACDRHSMMKVFHGLPNAASRAPCALTIGNFDGVHRGHQALLAQVCQAAERLGVEPAVMTFEPHPREFLAQMSGDYSRAPNRIANLRDKLGSLAASGIKRVIVEHFNKQFASLSPESFTKDILVDGLHVKWLMVGEDFCYGSKRAGNVAMLKQAGEQYGFEVHALPAVLSTGTRISSSAVRKALAVGDFTEAERLLGHPYAMSGHVVHGQKLGRTIGFPTANLRITHQRPALNGIFVVQVHGLALTPVSGVASLGLRPTVETDGRTVLEVHLFDYEEVCYGKLVRVEFLQKLRDVEKFDDLSQLSSAIEQDVQQARTYFAQAQPRNESPANP